MMKTIEYYHLLKRNKKNIFRIVLNQNIILLEVASNFLSTKKILQNWNLDHDTNWFCNSKDSWIAEYMNTIRVI